MEAYHEFWKKQERKSIHPIELGAVVSVEPLALEIGGVVYSSEHWLFYAPVYGLEAEIKKIDSKTAQSGRTRGLTADEGTIAFDAGRCVFALGDVVMVQQGVGDKHFFILGKARRL